MRETDGVSLEGLDHVIQLTTVPDGTIYLRAYTISFKKAPDGGRVPRLELELMGPSLDLTVRRVTRPGPGLHKEAHRIPKECVVGGEANNAQQGCSPSTANTTPSCLPYV